ncbi:hypothetical protein ACIBL8_43030 [Streptomyces sp. NPDC050523]|uniref:hypothetical protein n=1 Tax=Streptomyces sp. NPDC050523 TaxID=3365622 RepID=UPI00378DF060
MTPSPSARSRRFVAAAAVLAVIAVAIALLVLAATSGVPKGWWPHTGRAFAADTHTAGQDPCDLITGPGTAYCKRSTSPNALHADREPGTVDAALRLVPAGAGVAALRVWPRTATWRGRR